MFIFVDEILATLRWSVRNLQLLPNCETILISLRACGLFLKSSTKAFKNCAKKTGFLLGAFMFYILAIGQIPLHQFPHSKSVTSWQLLRSKSATSPQHKRQVCNKSVTSWHGQKSVVSVVSCHFPNSITTTCCQLVADLLSVSLTSPQQVHSKLATSPFTGKLRGNVCNGF